MPVLLFFAAAASGDTGGPLFWPLLAVVLGAVGLVVGLYLPRSSGRRRESSPTIEISTRDAQLFESLASDLTAMLDAATTFGQTSPEWQACADHLRERLDGIYGPIYSQIPHDLEHYLADSDIRQRDIDYQAAQEGILRSYVTSLTRPPA